MTTRAIIIIPSRYGSSRLPGKPLVQIAGKSMIQRVYDNAKRVEGIEAVYVATDDERIKSYVESFGGQALMTSKSLRNGTDRCFAAAQMLPSKQDIIINMQGDAPLVPPDFAQGVLQALQSNPAMPLATPAMRMTPDMYAHAMEDFKAGRSGGTTVTFRPDGQALYFSKTPIPFIRNLDPAAPLPVYKHIGLYGYRYAALERYVSLTPTTYEEIEGLEQLRALEHGMPIHVVPFDTYPRNLWSVDTAQDLARVEAILAKEGELT